jgi:hypothetical protein
MSNVQNEQKFKTFGFWKFGFISDFDIRISNFIIPQNFLGFGFAELEKGAK